MLDIGPRPTIRRSAVVSALTLAVIAWSSAASSSSVTRPTLCGRAATGTPTDAQVNLDQSASLWGVYCDPPGTEPRFALRTVTTPSRDGRALECSYRGGTPYAGVHCYRTLTSRPAVTRMRLALEFRFSTTTCNNASKPSRIQALEFSASRWTGSERAEIAAQYRVVGSGAPQWLIWDGTGWTPLDSSVGQCLTPNRWHRFALSGRIVNHSVRYVDLSIDGRDRPLTRTFAQVNDTSPARLTVAVQADGNRAGSSYDFWIDRTALTVR